MTKIYIAGTTNTDPGHKSQDDAVWGALPSPFPNTYSSLDAAKAAVEAEYLGEKGAFHLIWESCPGGDHHMALPNGDVGDAYDGGFIGYVVELNAPQSATLPTPTPILVAVKVRECTGDGSEVMTAQVWVTEMTAKAIEESWAAESPDDGPYEIVSEWWCRNADFEFCGTTYKDVDLLMFFYKGPNGTVWFGTAMQES